MTEFLKMIVLGGGAHPLPATDQPGFRAEALHCLAATAAPPLMFGLSLFFKESFFPARRGFFFAEKPVFFFGGGEKKESR